MLERLAIFGATGDLTGRYLLPGLAALRASGYLGDRFQLIAAAREDWDDTRFREYSTQWLDEEASGVPPAARRFIVESSNYRQLDLADPASVASCIAGDGPVAAYLALPPSIFPLAIATLQRVGLPADSRLVVEKPFGEDLTSAIELNRLLASTMTEREIFRVDHFLAMSSVQTLLTARLANRVLGSLWSSDQIEEIEIIWEESLALEGRAGYYDGVGALKDMVQNHLLQVLCLLAMEPPITLNERDLRDRKVEVLRSIHPLDEAAVRRATRRARYRAGRIGERAVHAYVDETGVDPAHGTETFAEALLELDNSRWAGTSFRLRTGKAFRRDRKEVTVHFRPLPNLLPELAATPANTLRFGLEPEELALEMSGTGRGPDVTSVPLTLEANVEEPELPAYSRLLLNVLSGDTALSVRADEAEESWRVMSPIMTAWRNGAVPIEEYDAGSEGPSPLSS